MERSICINHLSVSYQHFLILKSLTLDLPMNRFNIIIGPNGCGKTTLIKTIAKLIYPSSGDITVDNRSISQYSYREYAKLLAYLPQSPTYPEGMCVSDIVVTGRHPYRSFFRPLSKHDLSIMDEVMEMMNINQFRNDKMEELSGGERQRVWIAATLAQETPIILLDEPTSYLDYQYQIEILDTLKFLCESKKVTIVCVLHDINLSARYADNLVALKQGELYQAGSPDGVVTEELIKELYQIENLVIKDPIYNKPLVIPMSKEKIN